MVERTMERPLEEWSPSLGVGEPLGKIRLCPLVLEPRMWFWDHLWATSAAFSLNLVRWIALLETSLGDWISFAISVCCNSCSCGRLAAWPPRMTCGNSSCIQVMRYWLAAVWTATWRSPPEVFLGIHALLRCRPSLRSPMANPLTLERLEIAYLVGYVQEKDSS